MTRTISSPLWQSVTWLCRSLRFVRMNMLQSGCRGARLSDWGTSSFQSDSPRRKSIVFDCWVWRWAAFLVTCDWIAALSLLIVKSNNLTKPGYKSNNSPILIISLLSPSNQTTPPPTAPSTNLSFFASSSGVMIPGKWLGLGCQMLYPDLDPDWLNVLN